MLRAWAGRPVDREASQILDVHLADYFDEMFMQGLRSDHGSKLLAALAHFMPEYSQYGGAFLPRVRTAP